MSKLPYLNLGCGSTFHKDWTNVDFISTGKEVIAYNLLKGIPFESNTFKFVYHSHILEHFLKKDADFFITECYRVLEKGGVIRVAVPDLEQIAKNYIKYLEEAIKNVPGSAEKYNWTLLEMYDQTVRTNVGGDMLDYIADANKNNDEFLLERNGYETAKLIDNIRNPKPVVSEPLVKASLKARIKSKLIDMLLKEDVKALNLGKFRMEGEIHQWMYDRYSLTELLSRNGFSDVKVVNANESAIPDWVNVGLDIVGGKVRKPDSLFMEAVKA